MLRTVFGTENELTFVISATGSGGMETAISNFVEPGTKVAVFANGFFCDRMTEMAKRHGAERRPPGEALGRGLRRQEAAEFIQREKPKVVMYVTAETSTGVFQRGEAICKAAHEVGRAGHCRLRHLARRYAGRRGQDRHRHRLQLHPEGFELSSGTRRPSPFRRARPSG